MGAVEIIDVHVTHPFIVGMASNQYKWMCFSASACTIGSLKTIEAR